MFIAYPMELNIWFDLDEDALDAEVEKRISRKQIRELLHRGLSPIDARQSERRRLRPEVIREYNELRLMQVVTGRKVEEGGYTPK